MWLERIVASALVRDNDAPDEGVRERLADLRQQWLIGRVAGLAGIAITAAGYLAGAVSPLLCLSALSVVAIHEAQAWFVRRAPTLSIMQRRHLASAMAFALWGAVTMYVVGAFTWLGPLPLFVVVCAFASTLSARGLAMLIGFSGLLAAGVLGADAVGWRTASELPPTAWGLAIGMGVVLPAIGALTFDTVWRLRRARQRAESAAGQLTVAQHELSVSHAQLQRVNAALADEVQVRTRELEERNHHLTVINALSFALAEGTEHDEWLERSLRLIGRLLQMRHVQLWCRFPDTAVQRCAVTLAGGESLVQGVDDAALLEVTERGLPRFSGNDGGGPDAAATAYGVVPLLAKGAPFGALAVTSDHTRNWPEPERRLLALVGRELTGAIENWRHYRAAMEEAARQALCNDVVRILDERSATHVALTEALTRMREGLAAQRIALLAPMDDGTLFLVSAEEHDIARAAQDASALRTCLETLLAEAPGAAGARLLHATDAPGLLATLRDARAAALVTAPVRSGSVQAGLLAAVPNEGGEWPPSQLDLLAQIAEAVGRRLDAHAHVRLQARRIHELSALAHIGETVQSTVDPDRLCSGFARGLNALVPLAQMYFARLGDDGEIASVSAYASNGRPTAARPTSPTDGRHAWMSARAATAWARDEWAPPDFFEPEFDHALVIPLRPKGQVLGMVVLAMDRQPRPEELTLADQAVSQLALALDSATLYQQATQRAARIQVLGNLARIVASVVDLREAFDAFAEEVRWLIPFDCAVMMRVDEARGLVEPYAVYPEAARWPADSGPLTGSLAESAVAAQHTVTLDRTDPACSHRDWANLGSDVTQAAVVPVFRGSVCAAVFVLARITRDEYALEDIAALDEVARLLAVSIERVELFEQAEHSARHDLLTGLPNYRLMHERLAAVRQGVSQPGTTALVMIDMDDLKLFNDTLGHGAGDQVIQLVGAELRTVCREADLVARVGGDEFVVVMEGATAEAAVAMTERLHEALRELHLAIPGAPTQVRVSAGVAAAPADAETMEELVQAADAAMYAAKFAGGARTAVASSSRGTSTRVFRARRDRLVETLVRAATAGASELEREAVALAQRYGVQAGVRLGMPPQQASLVRVLVAQEAARSVGTLRQSLESDLAQMLLRHLPATWAERDASAAALGQALARAAVQLAWYQLVPAAGAPMDAEEALARLRSHEDLRLDDAVLRELEAAALSEGVDRRRGSAAA